MDEFRAQLRGLLARGDTEKAEQVYTALLMTGQLHSARVQCLTYRCAERGCSLLDVVTLPDGFVLAAVPRYQTSPVETAATSTEAGRRNHTEDGQGRWQGWVGPLSAMSNPGLNCDHLRSVTLPDGDLQADLDAGHAVVRVRRNGSRYAVT